MKEKNNTNALQNLWQNTNFGTWFVLFLLFCGFVYVLRGILMPFVLGIILGYLFDPLVIKFEKIKMSRTWATIVVFVLVLLIIVPLLVVLFGVISGQLAVFIAAVPQYMQTAMQKTTPVFESLQAYFPDWNADNVPALVSQYASQILQVGGGLIEKLFVNAVAVFNVVSLLFITPVVAFYMLRDWDVFIKKADALLPKKSHKEIRTVFHQIDLALSGFIRGQLSVCVILGLYYGISLRLVGLEFGVMIGFMTGLISIIPYVGSITGFVLSLILTASTFDDWPHLAAVVIIFGIGQFLEGNFLTPKLVGDKVGLHPVWVMFALLAGGALLGFLGLMIAVPVASVIGILIRTGLKKYQKSILYLGKQNTQKLNRL